MLVRNEVASGKLTASPARVTYLHEIQVHHWHFCALSGRSVRPRWSETSGPGYATKPRNHGFSYQAQRYFSVGKGRLHCNCRPNSAPKRRWRDRVPNVLRCLRKRRSETAGPTGYFCFQRWTRQRDPLVAHGRTWAKASTDARRW